MSWWPKGENVRWHIVYLIASCPRYLGFLFSYWPFFWPHLLSRSKADLSRVLITSRHSLKSLSRVTIMNPREIKISPAYNDSSERRRNLRFYTVCRYFFCKILFVNFLNNSCFNLKVFSHFLSLWRDEQLFLTTFINIKTI